MHVAAPVLIGLGSYILGLLFHAFARHKGLGIFALILGLSLIGAGWAGYSVTIPKGSGITVNQPSPVVSTSHHATPTVTPATPRASSSTP